MNEKKVENSIEIIRKAEKLALALDPTQGFHVAFSGGKDSQCVLQLVKEARVKYQAFYSVTGIDAPDNVYFIRDNYPEVQFVHPPKNYLQLIETKGMPTTVYRYCCERLKEKLGAGTVMLDGVRAAESKKRATYTSVMVRSRRKENIQKGRDRNLDEILQNEHKCIQGKDRLDIHPILDWDERDVWDFIATRHLPINPLYGKVGRVGCMFCPFANARQLDVYETLYPRYKERVIRALDKFIEHKPLMGIHNGTECYAWWRSKKTLKAWNNEQCGG